MFPTVFCFVGINNKPFEVIVTPKVVVCVRFVNTVRKVTKFEGRGPAC
jgi:hypothetical protein